MRRTDPQCVRLWVPNGYMARVARSTPANAASNLCELGAPATTRQIYIEALLARRTSTSMSGVVAVAANPDCGKDERSSDCESDHRSMFRKALAHPHIVER